MNKTLLIVICDFLLLSMLALARFDREPPPEPAPQQLAPIRDASSADLVDTLRESLENERAAQEKLAGELASRAGELDEQKDRTESLEQEKSRLEGERERLERLRAKLDAERGELSDRLDEALRQKEASEAEAAERLADVRGESERLREEMAVAQERQRMLQEQLSQKRDDLEKVRSEAAALRERSSSVERDNAVLSTKLESVNVARERLENEVETLRTEKEAAHRRAAVLAENVGELAQAGKDAQVALSEEIRRSTPLSPNAVYDSFRRNRAVVSFRTRETTLLGTTGASYAKYVVFARSGNDVAALCECAGTPLRSSALDGIRSISASMDYSGKVSDALANAAFLDVDPRVVALPVNAAFMRGTETEPFDFEENPLRFSTAVVVTADGEKYGEAPIRVIPGTSRYIEVRSSIANRLFGSFSPSEGDIVFSLNGNLVGFMVSSSTAVVLDGPAASISIKLGDSFDAAAAKETGDRLSQREESGRVSRPSVPSPSGGRR